MFLQWSSASGGDTNHKKYLFYNTFLFGIYLFLEKATIEELCQMAIEVRQHVLQRMILVRVHL